MAIVLPRSDAARVRAAAHKMGIELTYQPTNETVAQLLRICGDYSLAMAATAPSKAQRDRWQRELVQTRLAIEPKGH